MLAVFWFWSFSEDGKEEVKPATSPRKRCYDPKGSSTLKLTEQQLLQAATAVCVCTLYSLITTVYKTTCSSVVEINSNVNSYTVNGLKANG